MKILFAIKSLDVAGGGAERVLTIVASGLAVRAHEVAVLTFDAPGGTSFYPLDARVRRLALGIGPTDRPSGPGHFAARVRALRRAVRARHPDVVVAFMHSMSVPLTLATAGLSVPRVVSEHTVPEYYRGRAGQYALFLASCMAAARVTVLSRAVRDMYPPAVRRRMVPVPNPVALSSASSMKPQTSGRTLLAAGRLGPEKGHATLIDAFALLAARFPDWNLRIVGDGELRDELEARVARHGLSARVTLPGTSARIEDEYDRADVFAVPSRYESFGMATAEALAAGVAVVGFADCPGTNELVAHDHNGRLVSVAPGADRAQALAAALADLMEDGALRERLGGAAPGSVARFSPDRVTDAWEALLDDVVRGCPRQGHGL